MSEWSITGRISPCDDGSMEVDLRAKRIVPSRSATPRVSAMTDDDVAATIELAKADLTGELQDLGAQMVDLMARQNKGGSVSIGRALREVWAPLAKAAASGDYTPTGLVYGMEQAISKAVPNMNYARKAAKSYNEEAPAAPAMASRYDTLGGGGNE